MNHEQLLKEIRATYGTDTDRLLHDLGQVSIKAHKKKASGEVLVSFEGIEKRYKLGRTEVTALSNVSAEINQGEFVALTGASGSGKSTLLNLIAGLDHPTAGIISVGGVSVGQLRGNAMERYRAETLGFVFQFFYLQPFLTLKSNVKVPTMFVAMNEEEREARAIKLIESVGLSDRANHLPKELSGGQMQRAAIARALMNQPKLILADEPTGNLDSTNAEAIMELFQQVREEFGTTIILVTHDTKIASQTDRIIELKDGKII